MEANNHYFLSMCDDIVLDDTSMKFISGDIHLYVCNKSRMVGRSFIKFVMDVILFQRNPNHPNPTD